MVFTKQLLIWICGKRHRKKGKHYKDYFYYGCKHRRMQQGHSCIFNNQLQEEKLDNAVAEVISKLVSNPKLADMMQKKIHIIMNESL